jgi:gluconolactonase
MSWIFEHVAGPVGFAEGPAWDGAGLLFSDIKNSRTMRYDPASGSTAAVREGTNEANGLMFDTAGRLYACEGGGRRLTRYEPGGGTTVIAERFEGRRLNSPNDLAIDARGRIWFTDPRYGDERGDMELDHESVFRLDPQPDGSWTIRRMTFDTTRPNGLLISADQKTLYVAQSEYGEGKKRELRAYAIQDDERLGPYEVLHNFYPHRGIDGMCLDTDGNIIATAGWEVSGPGPMIYVFAPNGRVLETHPVPSDRPTNCTFGGPKLSTLYVTTGSGDVFRVETGRRGRLWFPRL